MSLKRRAYGLEVDGLPSSYPRSRLTFDESPLRESCTVGSVGEVPGNWHLYPTAAIMEWREPRGERYADLKTIKQPTLVVNGNDDIMVPTINSFTLSQHVPNAQLIVYPDSGHGAHFQYPELFVAHTKLFLEA